MSKGQFELRAGPGSFSLRTGAGSFSLTAGPGAFQLWSQDPFKTKVQQAKEHLEVKKERELGSPVPPPLEAMRPALKRERSLSIPENAERAARAAPTHKEDLKRRQAAEAIRAKMRPEQGRGERGR